MLENLNQLVKENTQGEILNNDAIPNDKNDAAVAAASGSIMDALKQQLSSGNVNELMTTLKGGDASGSPVTQQATNGFIDKLAGMGINLDAAKGIAASVIPQIMSKFVNKTNDPNDSSFDIKDILSNISGPDGKFQLSDLTDMFNKDSTEAKGKGDEEGGLMDKLKGLF